jgi:hypothetical protein
MNLVNSEACSQLEHPTNLVIANCSDKLHRAETQPGSSSQAEAPGSSKADHIMTEQASSPGLKLESPNLELRRHLENFHTSKEKLNFGFREAISL